jgi:hypothetical protein
MAENQSELRTRSAMSTDEAESTERILDGRSWEEFCDALKAAGSVVLADDTPRDAMVRAEGWRYLSRLTRAALETFVEASDAAAPQFQQTTGPTVKMGMDNPDNIYLNAPVNGTYRYQITGQRGSVHYLGFGTQAGNYGSTGNLETTGSLDAAAMKIDADGSFRIIASSSDPGDGSNWLPMTPDTRMIQIRQTRVDHRNEKLAQVDIRRIDGPAKPRPLDPARLDRMLQGASRFVMGCSKLFKSWADGFSEHVNSLPRFPHEKAFAAGGDPNIAYYHSAFRIDLDEVLIIEATPPACDYWNFQLANYWLESLDYRFYDIHLNKGTAAERPDGSVRIVIAHEDPGCANWLDPCGHVEGTMCWRWVRAESHPEPSCRLMKLADFEKESALG